MDHTIIDYLSKKSASFVDEPFNEVDSLVLSTVAYYRFECGVLGRTVPSDIVPLPVAICGISHVDLYGGIWLERMGGDYFLQALLASPRFMDLRVGYYVNDISSHFEKQFSAMTFFLPDDTVYIAFRGTDNSLAGWKEDFNLTFMEEVPSQVSARTYLEDISYKYSLPLLVGGHSKGGNLAEYAALTCSDQAFEKVVGVFNHDGPGFAFVPSERLETSAYDAKLFKTVPESSVFGMLMEDRGHYRVVRASGVLFTQHASTHWSVEGDSFVLLDHISPDAEIISATLNNWAKSYEPDKRELFIDAVYDIFCAANVDTLTEFSEKRTSNALAVATAAAKLPSDMRSTLLDMIRDIAPIVGAEAAKKAKDKLHIDSSS